MKFFREPSIPHGVFLLLIALGSLWYSGLDYGQAKRRYQAAGASPIADYVVEGQRQATVGSGKSRHTEYYLQLDLFEPQPAAPQATEVRVASKVYARSRNGDHWRARVAGGELLFDPDLSGVERDKRMWIRVMALVFGAVGGIYLVLALRKA